MVGVQFVCGAPEFALKSCTGKEILGKAVWASAIVEQMLIMIFFVDIVAVIH